MMIYVDGCRGPTRKESLTELIEHVPVEAGKVLDFSKAGPLFHMLSEVPKASDWLSRGKSLIAELSGDEATAQQLFDTLDDQLARRVYHLYLPMYFWMRGLVRETISMRKTTGDTRHRAVTIGLSAPQGCGKTTVVEVLTKMFTADGLGCAHVSFDDFYLRGEDQDEVAAAHPTNAILQVRGNAGTHDLALGKEVLEGLCSGITGTVDVPCYDKSARSGRGDRHPRSRWTSVQTPCDVVLFEGWMAGFKHRGDSAALADIHPALPEVDALLSRYSAWDNLIDAWCVMGLSDKTNVFKWRLEAEHKMKAGGRPGMSDDQVRDFVNRYMPAYEAYCPALYAAAETSGVDAKPTMMIYVDGCRGPTRKES